SPVIARLAKETGALTVGVVTKPFSFEGNRRAMVADEAIDKLREAVDTLIVIPNQRLMDVIDRKMTLLEAFKIADNVLGQAVGGIADIITTPGLVNVDFADVKTIMKDAGTALLGIGTGVGENRAQMAARAAVSSPLLDLSIDGARGVLFNISGGPDLTMFEVDEAARIIQGAAEPDANVIFGSVIKSEFSDQIRITVIATGFDETSSRIARMGRPVEPRIEGVVSDTPKVASSAMGLGGAQVVNDSNSNTNSDDTDDMIEETLSGNDTGNSNKDEFGDKFEIPAFLRKIH
ncbi:MAG: cell division protein FtsZ, partial [Patescibacteria group bacterium]